MAISASWDGNNATIAQRELSYLGQEETYLVALVTQDHFEKLSSIFADGWVHGHAASGSYLLEKGEENAFGEWLYTNLDTLLGLPMNTTDLIPSVEKNHKAAMVNLSGAQMTADPQL